VLRGRERRILDAFVDALIPEGPDALGPSGLAASVPEKLGRFLESLPPAQRKLVPFALWAVELYPLALGPVPRTFSGLSRESRTRVLDRLEHHRVYPLRSAYYALKVLSFLLWGEGESVSRATGFGAHCS